MTTKTLTGFRLVATHRGDTLQRVAVRELGDAAKWSELAEINRLRPPYLTNDEGQVSDSVKLTGEQLLVPAASPRATTDTNPESVLGRDIHLDRGELHAENGDLSLVEGADNYVQALSHLVVTEPGDLLFHPAYGCGVRRMIGGSNSRAKVMLASRLVKRAIAADPRTSEVRNATVTATGDSLRIEATAVAIHDRTVRLSQVF